MLNSVEHETGKHAFTSGGRSLIDSKKEKMQRFLQWLTDQGSVFPFCRMEVQEGYRKMRATTRIGKGVLILHIPRPMMITEEMAMTSSIGKLIAANTGRMSMTGYFSAFLLDGRSENSFWKPYSDVLPEDFSTHPFFFSEPELDALQGTAALRQIRDELKWIKNEYKLLQSFLPPEKRFTHADYLWAKCAVMSRVHHLVINQRKTRALTPLADMPDHDSNANVRWESEASQGFIYTAKRTIEIDEELTIDYRTSNNGATFRIYGFCPAVEANNKTEIEVPSIPPDHPFYDHAKDLGVPRGDKRAFMVPANPDNADAQALISYLRLSHLRGFPGSDRSMGLEPVKRAVPFVNASNEVEALSTLETACSEQLQRFSTTIDEDEALLESNSLSINASNAVRVRLGEKKVLKYFQEYARAGMLEQQKEAV